VDPTKRRSPLSEYVPNELLSRLVGFELFSVQFVQDYVQLRFQTGGDAPAGEMPVLNCDAWPLVEYRGQEFREPDLGYADALRHLIPELVIATSEGTGTGLRISFVSGSITLHPTREEVFVEIAYLSGFADHEWMVWRPGEDSFEDI
jgi:hypothetical protein